MTKERIQGIKDKINYVLSILCAILLSFMTILVLVQVFTRYVLGNPAAFTEELVKYSLIWTGFVGATYAFSTREHMALEYYRDKLPRKTRNTIVISIDVLIILIALLLFVIGGTNLVFSSTRVHSALLGIPRSLVYLIGPVSGVFIVFIQILNIMETLAIEKEKVKES